MEVKSGAKKSHSVTLENRKRAILSGVEKVVASNDNSIMLETSEGGLSISGAELKITKFDVESGALILEGTVNNLKYSAAKIPLAKRLFK